jgi:sulfate permease, SulP family
MRFWQGLPPEVGLYASIAPLLLYAIFGTSRTLAVGPVAVASLMTAAAVGQFTAQGTPEYHAAAIAAGLPVGADAAGSWGYCGWGSWRIS